MLYSTSGYISNALLIKDENITFIGEIYTDKISDLNTLIYKTILLTR